jgi:hypothetical protein
MWTESATLNYTMCIFKNILHGAETWPFTKIKESTLQAIEMEFLRGFVGKARRGRIRKTYIQGDFKVEEMQNQTERAG